MEIKTTESWRRENIRTNEVQGVNVEEDIDVTPPQLGGEGWILHARTRQYRSTQLVGNGRHRHTATVGLVMLVASEDGSEMMRGLLHQPNCLYASSLLGGHNNVHALNRSLSGPTLSGNYRGWGVARYRNRLFVTKLEVGEVSGQEARGSRGDLACGPFTALLTFLWVPVHDQ